jgi:hypothetical protein
VDVSKQDILIMTGGFDVHGHGTLEVLTKTDLVYKGTYFPIIALAED